jgi:aminomethyltransferase
VSILATELSETPLTGRHRALAARMAPFAGYAMPIQYADGILKEHQWTRAQAGLFDVSHMGPALVTLEQPTGDPAADHAAISALVEPLICGDLAALNPGRLRYSLLLNDDGGIDDDLIVGRLPDLAGTLYLVVNAATKAGDFARVAAALRGRARLKPFEGWGLLALQGPKAAAVLAGLGLEVDRLRFMQAGRLSTPDGTLVVSRCGYTGEDGFEILVPAHAAGRLWDRLLRDERVRPVGLGARDSLRLEAGLPLYGHDLDPSVSPAEAGLEFALSPRRRRAGDFPGAVRVLQDLERGPPRVRVGLLVEGAPAREGAVIADGDGESVGVVTSGGFSPTLGSPIALGFAPPRLAAPGTALGVIVRERVQRATVAPLPFVAHRYHRNP